MTLASSCAYDNCFELPSCKRNIEKNQFIELQFRLNELPVENTFFVPAYTGDTNSFGSWKRASSRRP